MAKDTAKPSQLSEEFIQDSGDEADKALSGTAGHGTKAQAATNGHQSSGSEDSEAEESESESASDSAESQDDSAAGSEPSSTSKKRSRDTVPNAPTPIAKRPKKRCALLLAELLSTCC